MGIYYYGGILYIDAEWLGLEKIALEFNMFEAIMEVLLASNLFASLGGEESATTGEAVSASELIDFDTEYVENGVVKKYDVALLLSMALSDTRFILEVADGLTQLVLNKLGLGFSEIEAALEIRYNETEYEDGSTKPSGLTGYVAINNDKNERMIMVELNVNAPDITFSQRDISVTDFDEGYNKLELFNEDGSVNLEGLFLELEGGIEISAYQSDSTNEDEKWQLGDWIESLYTTDSAALGSLLYQLLVAFEVPSQVTETLGFKISALLRFDLSGINMNDKTFNLDSVLDFNYILTHSDLSIEIWDGNISNPTSQKIMALYLVYKGENDLGVPYSTLYLDIETALIQNVHIMVDGFDIGSLLGLLGTTYDAELGVTNDNTVDVTSQVASDAKLGSDGNFADLIVKSQNDAIVSAVAENGAVKFTGNSLGECVVDISYTNNDGELIEKTIKVNVVDKVYTLLKTGGQYRWEAFDNPQ